MNFLPVAPAIAMTISTFQDRKKLNQKEKRIVVWLQVEREREKSESLGFEEGKDDENELEGWIGSRLRLMMEVERN